MQLETDYHTTDGDTSCMTLAAVVRLMARHKPDAAVQISRLCLPSVSKTQSEDKVKDSMEFAQCIEDLIAELHLVPKSLTEWRVQESEIPVIMKRALKGPADEKFVGDMEKIVRDLF
jgi:alcohol dehydrogenase class IV